MITNTPILKKPQMGKTAGHDVRVHQVFIDADLRCQIDGLMNLCRKHKLRPEYFDRGQLIVFINTARNYIKVLACNGSPAPVLASYRLPSGRIYDLSAVQYIPEAFNSNGAVDFDYALKTALENKLGARGARNTTGEANGGKTLEGEGFSRAPRDYKPMRVQVGEVRARA